MSSESFATLPYIISAIGIMNGFILGFYLLFAKLGRKRANVLLGAFILLLSYRIFRSWLVLYHGYNLWISSSAHILIFVAAPLLYNYFKVGLKGISKINYIDFLFVIPLISVFVSNFKVIIFCTLINMLFYLILSAKIFMEYVSTSNKKLIAKQDYIWYRNLIIIIFITILGYGVNMVFRILPYIAGAIGYSFLVYVMLYYWNKHQQTRKQKEDLIKYKNSTLHTDSVEEHLDRLQKFMKDDKGYKDYTLSLVKLAEILNITHHQLSQLINQKIGKNFADYINEFRVNEAKLILANPDYEYETAENIGYEAGFSNTSSFYSAFKKFTGTSPSKYRKENVLN